MNICPGILVLRADGIASLIVQWVLYSQIALLFTPFQTWAIFPAFTSVCPKPWRFGRSPVLSENSLLLLCLHFLAWWPRAVSLPIYIWLGSALDPLESSTVCWQLGWLANSSSDAAQHPLILLATRVLLEKRLAPDWALRSCWLWFLQPRKGVIPACLRGVVNIS